MAPEDARNHTQVAQLLIVAGASLEWESPTDQPAESLRAVLREWGRTLKQRRAGRGSITRLWPG